MTTANPVASPSVSSKQHCYHILSELREGLDIGLGSTADW